MIPVFNIEKHKPKEKILNRYSKLKTPPEKN